MRQMSQIIGYCTSRDQSDEEDIRFLINMAIAEAQLFWQRTNTMLVVEAASVAGVSTLLASNVTIATQIAKLLCGVGAFTCVVWWQMTRMSRYYNNMWLVDARKIAERTPALKDVYNFALGFHEQTATSRSPFWNWRKSSFSELRRPPGPAASYCVYGLVVLFFIIWLTILLILLCKPEQNTPVATHDVLLEPHADPVVFAIHHIGNTVILGI